MILYHHYICCISYSFFVFTNRQNKGMHWFAGSLMFPLPVIDDLILSDFSEGTIHSDNSYH